MSWLRPAISVLALGIVGILVTIMALQLLVSGVKARENIVFFVSVIILPPSCAFIWAWTTRRRSARVDQFISLTIWFATMVLAVLAVSVIESNLSSGWTIAEWSGTAQLAIGLSFVFYVGGLILMALDPHFGRYTFVIKPLRWQRAQIVAFAIVFPIAAIVLFRLDPSVATVTPIVGLFFSPPFLTGPDWRDFHHALSYTAVCIVAIVALVLIELAMLRRNNARLAIYRRIAYAIGIALIPLLYFDYSLDADGLHYIAYLGPALHIFHGGTLLVDTFSQYGFGPVLLMMIGGKPSITNANLIVQFSNFLFYAIWLTCLYRMTPLKLAAILIGILSIAVFLGGWSVGRGNVNTTPSVMAFRYLPALLMVLAILHLDPPRRHSVWTALTGLIAGLWSVETYIGTCGVQLAFLAFLGLRDRAPLRFVQDAAVAVLPGLVAVAIIVCITWLTSGSMPNFRLYLEFLASYNPTSAFWSMTAQPGFFGWMTMLACVFVVLADATTRALSTDRLLPSADDAQLYYSYVPLTALLLFQASYYVFRSADFTLIIALFPFLAIAISVALRLLLTTSGRIVASLFALPSLLIVTWVLIFTFLALLRPSGPYEFVLQECRDRDRCDPASLLAGIEKRRQAKDVLERVNIKYADNWFDKTFAVRDAVEAIARYGGSGDRTTVLLGKIAGWDVASEFALMYAGKWHRWPRSVTFSDDLIPRLVDQIVNAPVQLQPGELVIVRQDERTLGAMERGILQRIRQSTPLCRLPFASSEIFVFQVASDGGCPSS